MIETQSFYKISDVINPCKQKMVMTALSVLVTFFLIANVWSLIDMSAAVVFRAFHSLKPLEGKENVSDMFAPECSTLLSSTR